jgi:hypothetical protein
MIALFAAALMGATQPACAAPAGADALWTAEARYVIVGEQHGTTETPAAFAQLVCAAAARGPVTVALEFPESMQSDFDAFLAAPDDASAATLLLATPFSTSIPDRQDGRGSVAMLEMLQSIRRLKAEGRDVTIRTFVSSRRRPDGFDQNYHELDMAAGLARAAKDRPEARVVVLVGSFHAAKARYFADDFLPAAAHLPPGEVISLQLPQQGGQSWSCTADGCGPLDIRPVDDVAERGVILRPVDDGLFDGVLALGPVTASPPALPLSPP